MRIALLHYSALPVVGGVEQVIGQHARLMLEDGHQVTVIAGRGEAIDPRIHFICLPAIDSRHPLVLRLKSQLDRGEIPAEFPNLVESLAEDLRRSLAGIDLLIAHNVCSLHKNLALTAAVQRVASQANAPRLILWHHDLAWTGSRYQTELHPGYPWDLLRTAWPGATQVVVSELRRQELAGLTGLSPDRIQVIPNGLDLAQFLKLETQTQALIKSLNLLESHPLFTPAGTPHPAQEYRAGITCPGSAQGGFPSGRSGDHRSPRTSQPGQCCLSGRFDSAADGAWTGRSRPLPG